MGLAQAPRGLFRGLELCRNSKRIRIGDVAMSRIGRAISRLELHRDHGGAHQAHLLLPDVGPVAYPMSVLLTKHFLPDAFEFDFFLKFLGF